MIIRFIIALTLITGLASAQCTLKIDSIRRSDVSCNGAKDGSIMVFSSAGSGAVSFSNGAVGSEILPLQGFNDASTISTISGTGPSNKWWSPSSCNSGAWFSHSSAEGCISGSAKYTGKTFTYNGCFLRSPQINMNGIDKITISFDITHSFSVNRPNDNLNFSVWVNNKYLSISSAIAINGVVGKTLYFNKQRNCERVEVTVDLSSVPSSSRSDFYFYFNSDSQYSNSLPYYVLLDNVSISKSAPVQTNNIFSNLSPGSYIIKAFDASGCSYVLSTPVVIAEPAAVKPIIYVNQSELSTSDFISYQWYLNGSPIQGGTGKKHVVVQNGTYMVEVMDAQGCKGLSDPFNYITTNNNNNKVSKEPYRAYPNPFSDFIEIKIPNNSTKQPLEVALYNMIGTVVYKGEVLPGGQMTIPAENLPGGNYFLKITGGSLNEVKRFVKRND